MDLQAKTISIKIGFCGFVFFFFFFCVLEMKRKRNGETYGACKGVFGERWSTSGSPAPIELRSLLRSKPFLSLSLSLSSILLFFFLSSSGALCVWVLQFSEDWWVHCSPLTHHLSTSNAKAYTKISLHFFFFFTYHYNCHISHYKNFCQIFFRLFLYELILF